MRISLNKADRVQVKVIVDKYIIICHGDPIKTLHNEPNSIDCLLQTLLNEDISCKKVQKVCA